MNLSEIAVILGLVSFLFFLVKTPFKNSLGLNLQKILYVPFILYKKNLIGFNSQNLSKESLLKNDDNVFDIIVTAENGTTKKYTITVVRNNQYIITYNSNGGSNVTEQIIIKGEKIG